MIKLIKQFSVNTFFQGFFILLSSLFVSENVFSQDQWNRDYTKVNYDPAENSITIEFKVFDYNFRVNKQVHAYLKECDFQYTTDFKYYYRLVTVKTEDQQDCGLTNVMMLVKTMGKNLQILNCPEHGKTLRLPYGKQMTIQVKNFIQKLDIPKSIAVVTVKWLLDEEYKDVKRIRLKGTWQVEGGRVDYINNVDYDLANRRVLKSTVNQSANNQVKVTAHADDIVITDAENGENIKVYNLAGVEVQSTVTKGDVVNIKLPKNQIYFVNIGQARYKVAM